MFKEYYETILLCKTKGKRRLKRLLLTRSIKFKSSRLEEFCKKGVLRSFAKFAGKYLCQSLFFNKVGGLRQAKADSGTGVFPQISKCLRKPFFAEHLRRLFL